MRENQGIVIIEPCILNWQPFPELKQTKKVKGDRYKMEIHIHFTGDTDHYEQGNAV